MVVVVLTGKFSSNTHNWQANVCRNSRLIREGLQEDAYRPLQGPPLDVSIRRIVQTLSPHKETPLSWARPTSLEPDTQWQIPLDADPWHQIPLETDPPPPLEADPPGGRHPLEADPPGDRPSMGSRLEPRSLAQLSSTLTITPECCLCLCETVIKSYSWRVILSNLSNSSILRKSLHFEKRN